MTTYPGTIHDHYRAAQFNAVRRGFTEPRAVCDKRGYELLDALEDLCLDWARQLTEFPADARCLPSVEGERKVEA